GGRRPSRTAPASPRGRARPDAASAPAPGPRSRVRPPLRPPSASARPTGAVRVSPSYACPGARLPPCRPRSRDLGPQGGDAGAQPAVGGDHEGGTAGRPRHQFDHVVVAAAGG